MSEHDIEEGVRVYLEWVDGQWFVDPVTVDGSALDSTRDDGPSCDYNHETEEEFAECEELIHAADEYGLPTAQELIPLIAKHMTAPEIGLAIRELCDILVARVRPPG